MNRTRTLAGTALAALVAGSVLVLAMGGQSASATTSAVTASTHEAQNPDTTSGTVTSVTSSFGYVWAYDTVTKTFTATPDGNGSYVVDETVNGSFKAFSSPNTGLAIDTPIKVSGSIYGTNEFTVTSSTAPQSHSLPAQTLAGTSTTDLVKAMFPGSPDVVVSGGDTWVFTYKAGSAGTMTQSYNTPTSEWGNITAR